MKQKLTYHFTNEKAGMEGLDRAEIDKIIYENTKDSVITRRKEEERKELEAQVEVMKHKLASLHKNEILYQQNRQVADSRVKDLKNSRIFNRFWLHIDMDMFYAAVEIRDNPSLKDQPVAVGDHRMVSTSNYIARRYGVRSAMPGWLAVKLCEKLVFVHTNFNKYEEESRKIMQILKDYDSDIEIAGLDEAYLDITNFCKNNYISEPSEFIDLIKEIKAKIFEATQLTASIGIAGNKMLAKICSDKNKPDGFYYLPNTVEAIDEFMNPMSVRKIPSVGEKTEQKLNLLGISTCQDVIEKYVDIFHVFSESMFDFLLGACFGRGTYFHDEVRDTNSKSISSSETFQMSNDADMIYGIFYKCCKKASAEVFSENFRAKTLTVEIRDKDDKAISKSLSLKKRFETESEIVNNGVQLLKEIWKNGSIRLVRIKLSNFIQVNPGSTEVGAINKFLDNMKTEGGRMSVRESSSRKNGDTVKSSSKKRKSEGLKYKTLDAFGITSAVTINHANKEILPQQPRSSGRGKRKPTPTKPTKRGKKEKTPLKVKTLDNFIIKK
jgi:DNA polymerase kappa